MLKRARHDISVALFFCALFVPLSFVAGPVHAETIRIATFNASLSRNGPGVLLRDLERDDVPAQVAAVGDIIRIVRPDILLINEFDYDGEGRAAAAFVAYLRVPHRELAGISYPYLFHAAPNTGRPSGLDLNGDGTTTGPEDAFGYGRFSGQYGMLLLSRFPIDEVGARAFSTLLWSDLPGATLPMTAEGDAFPSAAAHGVLRLSSKSHWDVPVDVAGHRLHIFASHPTPPVFDGPEDFNGKRNGDEIRFWHHYINGASFMDDADRNGSKAPAPFVILGDLNADPLDGEGDHHAITALLSDPMVIDPAPTSEGATYASNTQNGANDTHKSPPQTDTADWRDDGGPGNLRVDYVLLSRDLVSKDAGVFWPAPDQPFADLVDTKSGRPVSSDHRLVWVDVELPQ